MACGSTGWRGFSSTRMGMYLMNVNSVVKEQFFLRTDLICSEKSLTWINCSFEGATQPIGRQ
jgi:hypothetical protein